MTLDKKAILDTMDSNVYKQLITVVPDFFSDKYVVTKLVEKSEQPRPLLKYFESRVVASTHPDYTVSSVVDVSDNLADLIRQGYNVSISPARVRRNPYEQIVEEKPQDPLVIAEVPLQAQGFGHPYIFYSRGAPLHESRKIIVRSDLSKPIFLEGSARWFIHFAFVQAKGLLAQDYSIEKGWKLVE